MGKFVFYFCPPLIGLNFGTVDLDIDIRMFYVDSSKNTKQRKRTTRKYINYSSKGKNKKK